LGQFGRAHQEDSSEHGPVCLLHERSQQGSRV
jgi:hypothetical protein